MIYLTFGDKYSGVFQSQVIDVIKYINTIGKNEIKLISFVPYTVYKEEKKLIKSQYPNSQILPMIPSRNHWVMFHSMLLILFSFNNIKNKRMVCRGIWSTNIGLIMRKFRLVKWVCYDGRGASFAEWKEYLIYNTDVDINNIYNAEKMAVKETDHRIAVSSALVNYWNEMYQYDLLTKNFSIIPCTIAESFEVLINDRDKFLLRKQFGYTSDDLVVVFSGGIDKWQSPVLLGEVMNNLVENNDNIKFLFLSKPEIINHPAIVPFKHITRTIWVKPQKVNKYLTIGDFGLLIREKSITNKVAAPTKFAEYLACGLEIIITEDLGDYTTFVELKKCGIIYNGGMLTLHKTNSRFELYNMALNNFSKRSFTEKYKVIYN